MTARNSFTILLVDADSDDQFFFKEAITHIECNIQLVTASSPEETLEYLNANTPDFIFLDINMPFIDGKDSLQHIRSSKKFNAVNVIMLTTSSNEKDINDCFELGANLYVSKPSSQLELTTILQQIFSLYTENKFEKLTRENFVFELKHGLENY